MNFQWKKDPKFLPDNYPQVLKKMVPIECHLNKQPDHAKEMEEMKFSRKLSKEETAEWKGLIHYVAHVVRPEKNNVDT